MGYRGAKWEGRQVLLGESVQRLDVKNRVTLPARLRAHFAQGVVVSKGFDGCLFVFSPDGWEAYVDAQLGRLDPLSRRGREMSRWLYGGASETELDRQGRVMLPPAQLTHAGLERDIVVAGLRDHLEIWDLAAWRKREAEFEGSVEDVAESLSQQ
ncbi:MAG: division/cell wall cluster transcriptional repressor MraZ [Gaiellales bacterium]